MFTIYNNEIKKKKEKEKTWQTHLHKPMCAVIWLAKLDWVVFGKKTALFTAVRGMLTYLQCYQGCREPVCLGVHTVQTHTHTQSWCSRLQELKHSSFLGRAQNFDFFVLIIIIRSVLHYCLKRLESSVRDREESTGLPKHNPGQDTLAVMCPPCVIWATHIAVVCACVRAAGWPRVCVCVCFMPFGDNACDRPVPPQACDAFVLFDWSSALSGSDVTSLTCDKHCAPPPPLGLIFVSAEGTTSQRSHYYFFLLFSFFFDCCFSPFLCPLRGPKSFSALSLAKLSHFFLFLIYFLSM